MRFLRRLSIVLLSFVFLVFINACGNDQATRNFSPTLDHEIPADNIHQATETAKQVQVSCASNDCSSSVGMLAMSRGKETICEPVDGKLKPVYHPPGASACTFSLIAPNIIVTNSHCIPSDLKEPGSSCANRMWAAFPQINQYSAETVDCDQVLLASEIDVASCSEMSRKRPDYAFIKLSKAVNRPLLRMNQEGLPDQLQVSVIKMNPLSKTSLEGALEQIQCTVSQKSVVLPSFDNPQSPIALLTDCEVVPGNSGSPVIDTLGNIRAILYAKGALTVNDLPPFSFATNAACIPTSDGINKIPVSPECSVLPEPEKEHIRLDAIMDEEAERATNELMQMVKQWGNANDPRFEWTTFVIKPNSTLDKSLIKAGVGKFTKIQNARGNSVRNAQMLGFVGARVHCFHHSDPGYDSKTPPIEVDVPIWVMKAGIDDMYKDAVGSAQTEHRLHIQIRFSSKKSNHPGMIPTELWVKDKQYGTKKISSDVMEMCKEAEISN